MVCFVCEIVQVFKLLGLVLTLEMLAPRLSRMPSLLYSANCYTFFFSSSTAIAHCSAINSTGLLPRYIPFHGQDLSHSRPRNFLSQLTRMAHIVPAAIPDPGSDSSLHSMQFQRFIFSFIFNAAYFELYSQSMKIFCFVVLTSGL